MRRLPCRHAGRLDGAGRTRPRQVEGRGGEGEPRPARPVRSGVDREAAGVSRARLPRCDAAHLREPDTARQAEAARAVSEREREVTTVHQEHHDHAAPPARAGFHRLTGPGWLRVLWVTPLFFGLGLGLPVLIRWLAHWDPVWKGSVLVSVELVTTPIGFLVGLGGFDYWT